MANHLLEAVAAQACDAARISSAEIQKLRRDILPDGLVSRQDAEVLIAIDRCISSADAGWDDFVVETLVEFVVWTSRPTGYVDADTTDWLIASLSGKSGPAGAAMRIVFEIIREAEHVDEALLIFALRSTNRRARIAPDPAGLAGMPELTRLPKGLRLH